jgi:SET domain/Bromodomain
MKEGSEPQSESDEKVAYAILRDQWTPSAILPPHTAAAPSPRHSTFTVGDENTEDGTVESSEEEVEEDFASVCASHDSPKATRVTIASPGADESNSHQSDERPLRSTRLMIPTAAFDYGDPAERQKVLERHRVLVNIMHKKAVSIACCGMYLALTRRDPLLLFAEPVLADGYAAIVSKPIDFGKIRTNVLSDKYSSLGGFVSDIRLLCENALLYNPPGTIYWKTGKELQDALVAIQKRASDWIGVVKDEYSSFLSRDEGRKTRVLASGEVVGLSDFSLDPFDELRRRLPEAVDMFENWLRSQVEGDFHRTKENEMAYYGSLAVRRVAIAAELSLAPYSDSGGIHNMVSKRSHLEDEALRRSIDDRISQIVDPVQLKDITTWREESVVRLMRNVQSRRLERRIISENGCARCDALAVDHEMKLAMNADSYMPGKKKKIETDHPRVDASRMDLTTGLASEKCRLRVKMQHQASLEAPYENVQEVCVSVRGSKVHGWGLFADQPFKSGDVVAEYVGEYISSALVDNREKSYQEQRIQDYQFRLDDKLVIDATMQGGHARYINHNCAPNCVTRIVSGESPNEHLKRVFVLAQQHIKINEELSYDYQFPLELNLAERVPCNCQSDACRGFMNWDLPEKGSNNRALLVHKRGANMRDRIRRLGRPRKRDEA